MSIGSLLRDRVTLVKKDGTVAAQNVAASVQSKKIFISDTKLAIEIDDHILRSLPSGLDEDYIVTDATYHEGGSLSHWEVHYRRSGAELAPKQTIINNITGNNARVNIHSTDNSVNQVGRGSDEVFSQLIETVRAQIGEAGARDKLLELVEDMRQGSNTGSFKGAYQRFISAAAEHITIIAPFLPALTQLL
jgi:hypothetical protein